MRVALLGRALWSAILRTPLSRSSQRGHQNCTSMHHPLAGVTKAGEQGEHNRACAGATSNTYLSEGESVPEAVCALPCNSHTESKQLFDSSVQDVLFVLYLTNLVQSHVALDKPSTFALPLL